MLGLLVGGIIWGVLGDKKGRLKVLFVLLQTAFDYTESAWVTGIVIMIIAIVSAICTQETFGKDLNYIEE